jgi:DNA-binding NarL/FixJ family response regulator
MNFIIEDMLMHYGMLRRSGRYPWGSGENPYQHSGDFLSRVDELKKSNFTFTDTDGKVLTGERAIAASMGLTTSQLRTQISLANSEQRSEKVATARALREKGYSLKEIANKMGFKNDSSVRALLDEGAEARMNQAQTTAEILKTLVNEKGMIDVGAGVERELGVSKERLKEAFYILNLEGYEIYGGGISQVTNPGKQTNLKVLCPPGTEHKEIYNYENISSVRDYVSHDGGETFDPRWVYPESLSKDRLEICYAEDGGTKRDGLIEIRRGVDDLSLGNSHYAQVRILVDGTHYIKGMAVYSDDLPEGVDIRFNTNKKKGTPVLGPKNNTVLKPIKNDPENPFGSLLKDGVYDPDDDAHESDSFKGGQSYYYDKNGNKRLSVINKTREEGDWGKWADKLPSQFLSKQSISLATKQLNLSAADKIAEYEEICSLTNPTVKKALLKSFADDCDTAAVHLKAAALPRQKYQVILPVDSLKDNEIYAPNYKNGETVALIRYPHGGTFEIPILKVNNKQKDAREILGTSALDAVAINSKVAERLSGADFDGDTVMVIPCNSANSKIKITSTPALQGLAGFDPKLEYGGKPEGTFKKMKDTQKQMGVISNLITDMTLKGAPEEELARAVRHSMVVIDAEKHNLDYKQSEKDNGIAALKRRYQGHYEDDGSYHEGAATLVSRAKSETSVRKRRGSPTINSETGEYEWKTVDDPYYVDKRGVVHERTQRSTKMAETKDARELISDRDTPMENLYASYANRMKALANQARLEMLATSRLKYDAQANKKYKEEANSLDAKVKVAAMNAPRERQAQIIANATVNAKKQANPGMTKGELKKARQQAIVQARITVNAKRHPVVVTDREWEAIQAGAISDNKLNEILKYADIDTLKQKAMPRTRTTVTVAKQNKIKSMEASGYTIAEIADALNLSTSTIRNYLN